LMAVILAINNDVINKEVKKSNFFCKPGFPLWAIYPSSIIIGYFGQSLKCIKLF